MTIRGKAFWALDQIRGGRLWAELEDIRIAMSTVGSDHTESLLASQLKHTTSRVPFYKYLRGASHLTDFPVVNKAVIRANFEATIAAGTDTSAMHLASTSGSTGTPFRVYHDRTKRRRAQAEVVYWGQQAGYELGDPLVYIKLWSERNRVGRVSKTLRNIVPVDTTRLDGPQLLSELQRAARRGPVAIVSYSSSLEVLARALDEYERHQASRLRPPLVRSIVAQSESLSIEAKTSLKRHLNVDPVGRYGLEELGIVAQQTRDAGQDYRVNSASHVIEILKLDSTDAAPPGELGRIVVTELVNRAQPLIRYDTGDLGAFSLDPSGRSNERTISTIQGRRQDQIFDVNDNPLTTQVMAAIWWRFPEIRQYQLVQRDKADYLLRLNVNSAFRRQGDLVSSFRKVVGATANVDIELTDEEFVLSSGKRKSVVSHYLPSCRSGEGERE